MTAGGLKGQIVLCAIGISDLPYIFENFALQFPENVGGTDVYGRISLQLYRRTVKMTKAQNKYHFISNNSSLLALDLPPYGWIHRLHPVCNERGAVISTADR
jgi:hypothetical protein